MKKSRFKFSEKIHQLRKTIGSSIWPGPNSLSNLISLVRASNNSHETGTDVHDIVERVIRVSDLRVRDVMVPRLFMITIDLNSTFDEVLKIVIESGHSRFPVIKESLNDIEADGILLAKDILSHINKKNGQEFNLRDSLREIMYVPESMLLYSLLKRFQEQHNHMAIVINEYNTIAGLVTIEDVLEEIVGEIEDESDPETQDMIVKMSDDEYEVSAYTEIAEFNKEMNANFTDDVDTVGGLILKKAGYVPKIGEVFELDDFQLEIANADDRRILQLRVNRTPTTVSSLQK